MDLLKPLIWDNLVKAALARLFAIVPLLGWGPFGYIITWAAFKLTDKLYAELKLAVDLEVIAIKNDSVKAEYVKAAAELKRIADSDGIESEIFKNARKKHAEILSQFVRFNTV